MNEDKVFYAVVREGNIEKKFTKLHTSWMSAQNEAERLCREHNCSFSVLKLVATVSPVVVPCSWKTYSSRD